MEVLNQKKLREKFIKSGVKMIGPETIFFSKDTKIGKKVTIEPYVVIGSKVKIGNNRIMISGTLIVDSLKAKFPNEYAKLSFNPIVDVVVDTSKWLINSVTSRIDTLKLFQIKNYYEFYENKYYLPSTSTVEYFIKDMKLANWLKDDIPSMIGADQQLAKGQDIVKGMITVRYSDYLINKKLPDYIFKKKRID